VGHRTIIDDAKPKTMRVCKTFTRVESTPIGAELLVSRLDMMSGGTAWYGNYDLAKGWFLVADQCLKDIP